MPKDKDEARAEGFKRGLKGKRDAAGLTEGWTDDKTSGVARSEGWVAGKPGHWEGKGMAGWQAEFIVLLPKAGLPQEGVCVIKR